MIPIIFSFQKEMYNLYGSRALSPNFEGTSAFLSSTANSIQR